MARKPSPTAAKKKTTKQPAAAYQWQGQAYSNEKQLLKAIRESAWKAADVATTNDARINGRAYQINVHVLVQLEPMLEGDPEDNGWPDAEDPQISRCVKKDLPFSGGEFVE